MPRNIAASWDDQDSLNAGVRWGTEIVVYVDVLAVERGSVELENDNQQCALRLPKIEEDVSLHYGRITYRQAFKG